jgi:mono/diheme cytochrome c family protein
VNRLSRLGRIGAIALLLSGAAVAAAQAQAPADSIARQIELGKSLFHGKGLCFSCHGKEGDGLLGPTTKLAGRPLVHTKPTVPDVIALIKAGVDSAHSSVGQPMPARGGSRLTDAEVEAVARYVLELQKISAKKSKP